MNSFPNKQRNRYLVVGVWNSIFGISCFYFLSAQFIDTPDVVVLGYSYFVSIIQAHFFQRKFVWRSKASYFPELTKFFIVYIIQFIINSILLILSNNYLSTPRELSQTVILVIITVCFYFINKKGVFHAK